MRLVTLASLLGACLAPGLALAQAPGGQPGQQQMPPASPAQGADEVVGLFTETCVRYAGNPGALRSWLAQQQAPQMPDQMKSFFLGGRQGMVYDVSYQSVRLALVSGDDNTCSAYAEVADPNQVVSDLQQAMQEGGAVMMLQGQHPDQRDASLAHHDYMATINNTRWLVLVTTASLPGPGKLQAVLTLRPAV
jgi:hypothetical protein